MLRIGILGAGQLGRMIALAGYPFEMEFSFYDTSGAPSVGLGEIYSDPQGDIEGDALKRFVRSVDLVSYEFEHLPLDLASHVASQKSMHPSPKSLEVCQDRAKEKALFDQLAIPTPNYRIVHSEQDIEQAVKELGLPIVLKTTTEGYDGKGQFVLKDEDDCNKAWRAIGNRTLIAEAFVNFSRELSIIAARSTEGEIEIYPLAENQHENGILRFSTAPAPRLDEQTESQARAYIKDLIYELDHVGILTLELFETENGLIANEMAPRVHNSGHWSIEGAPCSQFENHLRAICGLPLGSAQAKSPTCMINIISLKGRLEDLLKLPYAHVHLYDKEERPGRKLGHVTVQADSYEELAWRVRNVASMLPGCAEFAGYEE